MILYHGSREIVEYPEIRKAKFNKDFYFGFYCTVYRQQAERWATRYGKKGYVNQYEYIPDEKLRYLRFDKMTEEWLDFIVACRQEFPIRLILWKVRWQMIPSSIIYRILLIRRYQGQLFGNW